MLGTWEELALVGKGPEVSYLGEIEIEGQVFVLVLDGQTEVFPLIGVALAKL